MSVLDASLAQRRSIVNSVDDFAAKYRARGWAPLPFARGKKGPTYTGWANFVADDSTRFDGHNIGILLGEKSNGLADVDLDCPEAVALAPLMLPPTGAIFGRKSKPCSHRFYQCDPSAVTKQYQFKELGMLVELRSTPVQTMVPPSLHPDGEIVEWSSDGEPAKIPAEELSRCVGDLAGLSLLVRNWPEMSGRYTAEGALIGALLRAGRSEDEVEHLITVIQEVAGRSRQHPPEKAVPRLARMLADGKQVPGLGRLKELLGAEIAGKVAEWMGLRRDGLTFDDFWAYMPQHNYIFVPARAMWPASSVSVRLPKVPLLQADGSPVIGDKGKPVKITAAAWLDVNKPVEGMTWAPGFPEVIRDQLMVVSGWFKKTGVTVFNLYLPPLDMPGDPVQAEKWAALVKYVYPNDADHMFDWFAHRVQHPEVKLNHALLLGGPPGIGKDTIVEGVADAIGRWNLQETTPEIMMTQAQNPYAKAVILRINESSDLGDSDRFSFYNRTKNLIAAPPPVIEVNEKYIRQYYIPNLCGVVITTNNTDGLYLPPEDRRHYVAWSERKKEDDFYKDDYWKKMWRWLNEEGGSWHVAAWLRARDISNFDPKAAPPLTPAFWQFVNINRSSQEAGLMDLLDRMGNPDALTIEMLKEAYPIGDTSELLKWLEDPKSSRAIPHKLSECGYTAVPNPDAKDKYWKVYGHRRAIYVKKEFTTVPAREAAAKKLAEAPPARRPKVDDEIPF
jgi:hypothetical protein